MLKKIFIPLLFIYLLVFSYSFFAKNLLLSLPDFPDTAASVKAFRDYGFFSAVPNFQFGGYYFFGSLPPVVSFFGSLIPLPPIYAVGILSILAELILALFILKKHPNLIGFALLALLLINPFTSSLFPLTWRVRQAFALVFSIALFFYKKPWQQFLLSLLAFLSQPVVAIFFMFFYSIELFFKKQYTTIPILFFPFLLSLPFMFKLFTTLSAPPEYFGCQGYFLFSPPLILSYALLLLIFLHAIEFKSALQKLLFLFALFPLFNAILFYAAPSFWQTFHLPVFADLCIDIFVVILLIFSIFSNSVKKPFLLASLFLLLSIGTLIFLPPAAELNLMSINNARMGTMEFFSSKDAFYPIHSSFRYPSLQYLYSKNITFACTPIPPQLSKGQTMEKLAGLECPKELDYALFVFYGQTPHLNYSCATSSDGIRTLFICNCR